MSQRKHTAAIAVLCALLFAGSSVLIYYACYSGAQAAAEKAQTEIKPPTAAMTQSGLSAVTAADPAQPKNTAKENETSPYSLPLMDFTALKATNPQIIAWLTIPNTDIDYAICQGADNSYYLTHTALRRSGICGSPFLDCGLSVDFSAFNNVVYGHNMPGGTMFSDLTKFKTRSFFDANPYGVLYTPGHTYKLDIFACILTNSMGDAYTLGCASAADRRGYLEMLQGEAMYWRDFGAAPGDHILTLSTCSYEFKDARTVISAIIVP